MIRIFIMCPLCIALMLWLPYLAYPQQTRGDKIRTWNRLSISERNRAIQEGMGKTWAVLIANNAYENWGKLDGEPYRDIEKLQSVLEDYHFDNIITKRDLRSEEFQRFLAEIDDQIAMHGVRSVLIYYAGHGAYSDRLDKGYWVPVNASKNAYHDYLDEYTIRDFLNAFGKNARHVLLIADCCFSGNVLRTRGLRHPTPSSLYHLYVDTDSKSIFGITSGRRKETVQNRSQFLRALVDLLRRNQSKYYRAEKLASELAEKVRDVLANQEPQSGPIIDSDYEYGQFVFIRRNAQSDSLATQIPFTQSTPNDTMRHGDNSPPAPPRSIRVTTDKN